jgi:hypothetical protein
VSAQNHPDHKTVEIHNMPRFLEYIPGGSISSLLKNYGAFEESLARPFARQIVHGLEYLHGRQIVHRVILFTFPTVAY